MCCFWWQYHEATAIFFRREFFIVGLRRRERLFRMILYMLNMVHAYHRASFSQDNTHSACPMLDSNPQHLSTLSPMVSAVLFAFPIIILIISRNSWVTKAAGYGLDTCGSSTGRGSAFVFRRRVKTSWWPPRLVPSRQAVYGRIISRG
jgi:hypothetical protein